MPQYLLILYVAFIAVKKFMGKAFANKNGQKAILVVIVLYLVWSYIKKGAKDEASVNIDDVNNQLAQRLAIAFDPYDGWTLGLGTDTKEVFTVASEIASRTTYEKVYTAYKNLYDKDLTSDLQSELSSAEYTKFLAIINVKKTNTTTPATNPKKTGYSQYVGKNAYLSRSGVNVRKGSNIAEIVGKFDVSICLGEFTGETAYYNNMRYLKIDTADIDTGYSVFLQALGGYVYVFADYVTFK